MKRLYNAVCTWLEADAKAKGEHPEQEHQPEGNNFAQAEHAHSYTSYPEMHSGYKPQSIDDDNGAYGRPISLRWHPNERA